jgi:cation transport ATPase
MIEFQVPAISCAHCVRAVTEAVQEVDPQAKVDVDVQTRHVKVRRRTGQAGGRPDRSRLSAPLKRRVSRACAPGDRPRRR